MLIGLLTLTSWAAVVPARKTNHGKSTVKKVVPNTEAASKNAVQTPNSLTICQSLKTSFGLHSFRWTAFANLFANVNEQATVQLLPFYIIYCVGVDFRDVGSVNALVAGGQLGAALISVPLFAYVLSLEKKVEINHNQNETYVQVHVPKIHPIYLMSAAALLKLCIQLPLTIAAAVNHNILYLAAAGFAGGTSTGGQPQVTQVLLGWVMDDDEMRNNGIRREGTIMVRQRWFRCMANCFCWTHWFVFFSSFRPAMQRFNIVRL